MTAKNIRWHQRLQNFSKAMAQLKSAVERSKHQELSNLEKQGTIQAFEFTHELAWNLIKDYFVFQGNTSIMGSRDAAREAFAAGLVTDGEVWMEMIKSRNHTSHTYNQAVADEIVCKIQDSYFAAFEALEEKMTKLMESNS